MCDPAFLFQLYTEVLTNRLGLTAVSRPDAGHLAFTTHELTYSLIPGGSADPESLRVDLAMPRKAFPGLAHVSDTEALGAVNTVNACALGVKLTLHDDFVVGHADLLLAAPDTLPAPDLVAAVVPRTCRALLAALRKLDTDLQFASMTNQPDLAGIPPLPED